MKRTLVPLLLLLVIACGPVSRPAGSTGTPLTVDQLKFHVLDNAGNPAFCDPDFYPLAREGGEQASANAMYPQIQADAELYGAIIEHEHLPAGALTDTQKLVVYRAFKQLRALVLSPSGGGYAFSYRATKGSDSYHLVAGTVSTDGTVTVTSSTPTGAPNCPICLSATTLIATPRGEVVVTRLVPGMWVWTQSANGTRIAEPILETGSTPVPASHLMVHLRLADGRELWASPGHRTAEGRALGSLAVRDVVDGSAVTVWELVPYSGGSTYDLLPSGPTGSYWADGILLSSTLMDTQR